MKRIFIAALLLLSLHQYAFAQEELTLHLIELQKQIDELKSKERE